jgi:hypothetical protein
MLSSALGLTVLAGHLQVAAYVWIFAKLYAMGSGVLRRGHRPRADAGQTATSHRNDVLARERTGGTRLALNALQPEETS